VASQWIWPVVAIGSAVVAATALVRVRRLARRIERLSESYWELRYEQGQLNARLGRTDGATAPSHSETPAGADAFVPLASLRKH
jgi:hypothetical protein